MINLHEFKKLLGDHGKQLSDDELFRLREVQYKIADIVFDQWLKKKNVSKLVAISEDTKIM